MYQENKEDFPFYRYSKEAPNFRIFTPFCCDNCLYYDLTCNCNHPNHEFTLMTDANYSICGDYTRRLNEPR